MTTQTYPDSITIKDIEGNDVVVRMKLSWGKERDILKIIGSLLSDIPEDLYGRGDKAPGIALMEYLTIQAPEKVSLVVGKILGVSPEEIDNKFDGDAVFEFIVPFIQRYYDKWTNRLGGLPFAIPGGGLIGVQPEPTLGPETAERPADEPTH